MDDTPTDEDMHDARRLIAEISVENIHLYNLQKITINFRSSRDLSVKSVLLFVFPFRIH